MSASISVGPIPEHIKVPTFMNGLRHRLARTSLSRKMPPTMEVAIEIGLVEEQSFNSASATAWYKPSSEKAEATPMELGSADVICHNCGKRDHVKARCYAKKGAGAKAHSKRAPYPKDDAKNQRARRTGFGFSSDGSGNVGAQ